MPGFNLGRQDAEPLQGEREPNLVETPLDPTGPDTPEEAAAEEYTETPKKEKLVNILYVGDDTYTDDELGTLSKGDERAVSADKADALAQNGDFKRL